MPRPPRIPVLALIALLLLAAPLVAACGGSKLADDPQAILTEATLPPPGPNASKLSVEFTPGDATPADGATTEGDPLGGLLGGPIQIEATTEGDAEAGVTGDAKITAGPANIALAFRANQDNTWLQVGDAWYELGQPLGIDFAGLGGAIGPLSEVVTDPKATAVEEIEGVECDRIDGRFNPAPGLTEQLQGAGDGLGLPLDLQGLAEAQAEISVWVSREDGVVRRIMVSTDGAADQAAGGDVKIDLTVVPAQAVEVTPPADAQPITDLLITLLGDQLGDLGDLGGQLGDLGDLGGLLDGLGGGAVTGENA
ncbi:MAG: hypothetical protein ACKOD0_06220 [Actinomycetota bacterium]